MHALSTGQAGGFWLGVARLLAGLGRAARVLLGLVLLWAAFVIGLLLAAVLVLRAMFRRGREASHADAAWHDAGRWSPRSASRRPTGEIVDVEAREVGPVRQ